MLFVIRPQNASSFFFTHPPPHYSVHPIKLLYQFFEAKVLNHIFGTIHDKESI